jgi:hypothetical protein
MKQDEQQRVLAEFTAGRIQVLLATCIGEEGLDVPQVMRGALGGSAAGRWLARAALRLRLRLCLRLRCVFVAAATKRRARQCVNWHQCFAHQRNTRAHTHTQHTPKHPQVDLIVCWDSASPSRLRQRSGRTGRHRPGRVVYLLSEGREQDTYASNREREERVKVRAFVCVFVVVQGWQWWACVHRCLRCGLGLPLPTARPRHHAPAPTCTPCTPPRPCVQSNLRNASKVFDFCPQPVRMLPDGVEPVPTLLRLPRPEPARGKVRACVSSF